MRTPPEVGWFWYIKTSNGTFLNRGCPVMSCLEVPKSGGLGRNQTGGPVRKVLVVVFLFIYFFVCVVFFPTRRTVGLLDF